MKLYCENLVKKYGVRTVVKGVSMEVEQGEIVGFLGPNGAGKTTSFYMITGQITPNEGKVFLDDEEITGLPMFKRAQKGIGYLPQEASVFRKMSVEDNLMSVMELSDMTKEERHERLEPLIIHSIFRHCPSPLPQVFHPVPGAALSPSTLPHPRALCSGRSAWSPLQRA